MSQPILVHAAGERAQALRALIAGKLPEGFEEARDIDSTPGLKVEPTAVALIAASGAVLGSLISSLAAVWIARIQQRGKEPDGQARAAPRATITVSTHSDDIVIQIGPDATAAIARAALPDDPADVVEIRLDVA